MSAITTHVLDVSIGRPAAGIAVVLERQSKLAGWQPVGTGVTDGDGRLRTLMSDVTLVPGIYRLTFTTGAYFVARGVQAFYPEVAIVFDVADDEAHYHVPLLLGPFGYTTYRGS